MLKLRRHFLTIENSLFYVLKAKILGVFSSEKLLKIALNLAI